MPKAKIQSKENYILEIAELLEKSTETKEILRIYTEKCGKGKRTIEGYINDAKIEVAKRNKHKEDIRLRITTQAVTDAVNGAIISDLELEAILCTIATGNLTVEVIIGGEAVLKGVTPKEQIAAINTLYQKRGSNAPTRNANTDTKGNDLNPTTIVTADGTIITI